ncbi:hypothetical protein [Flindersiella endophytica]
MAEPEYMDMAAIADYLGLTYATVRGYHGHAEKRRRDGNPRPGDLPPPDAQFGRSPVWLRTTIERWSTSRPGSGAGGGRPRRSPG